MRHFQSIYEIDQAYTQTFFNFVRKTFYHESSQFAEFELFSKLEQDTYMTWISRYQYGLAFLGVIYGGLAESTELKCTLQAILIHQLKSISEIVYLETDELSDFDYLLTGFKKILEFIEFDSSLYSCLEDFLFCKRWRVSEDPETFPCWKEFIDGLNEDIENSNYGKITEQLMLKFGFIKASNLIDTSDQIYDQMGVIIPRQPTKIIEPQDWNGERFIWKPENLITALFHYLQHYALENDGNVPNILEKAKELKLKVLTPFITYFLNYARNSHHLSTYDNDDIVEYHKEFDNKIKFILQDYIFYSNLVNNVPLFTAFKKTPETSVNQPILTSSLSANINVSPIDEPTRSFGTAASQSNSQTFFKRGENKQQGTDKDVVEVQNANIKKIL